MERPRDRPHRRQARPHRQARPLRQARPSPKPAHAAKPAPPHKTLRPLTATALAILTATGIAALAACSSQHAAGVPRLSVSGAYVPQPPLADMAAGYFTVRNAGGAADQLTSVTSGDASDITLMVTGSGGAMQDVRELAIPAGGQLRLHVGGDHLMLMGLKGRPAIGQRITFELHFAKSSPITVRVPVEPATYQPKG